MWNIFSCMGNNPRPGSSAYELYNKVPNVHTNTNTNNNNKNSNINYPQQTFNGLPAVRKTIQNTNKN